MGDGLIIKISADAGNFKAGLELMQEQTEGLNTKLEGLAKVAGAAFAASIASAGLAVHAYGEQKQATNELAQSLKTVGIYSTEMVANYREQAEAIEKKTGIDAEAIVRGQAMAQGLMGQIVITKELTQAVVDFAAHSKMDVTSAFDMVGRAAYGNVMMLKRHGVAIDENLGAQERLAKFVELVGTKFEGQAEAASKASVRMAASYEAVAKAVGAQFEPTVTAVMNKITAMNFALAADKDAIKFRATLLSVAIGVTGLATAAATAGMALIKLQAISGALGLAFGITLGPIIAVSAAVVALVAALGYWAYQNGSVAQGQRALNNEITETEKRIEGLKKASKDPIRLFFGMADADKKELQKAEAHLTELEAAKNGSQKRIGMAEIREADDKAKRQKALADKAQADLNATEGRRLAAQKGAQAVLLAEANKESKALIDIKKQEADVLAKMEGEKNKKIMKQLQAHLKDLQKLEAAQKKTDANAHKKFNDDILKNDKEYQSMSAADQHLFRLKHEAELQGQIDDEKGALDKVAVEKAKLQIDSNNTYLQEQIKYGTAYATINQMMHSAVYEGAKQAFGEMEQMQTSHNATLKAIGKIAAIANIITSTATSAMNIFQGFSSIPIVGYGLGIIGAAAAIAFGAEKLSQVNSANKGGVIPGGGPDQDSVLSFLTPGELVTPRSNYDETVNAVADSRNAAKNGGQSGGGTGSDPQVVGLLQQILDKVGMPPSVVLQKSGSGGQDAFWDYAIRQISARVQYGNARLITSPSGT